MNHKKNRHRNRRHKAPNPPVVQQKASEDNIKAEPKLDFKSAVKKESEHNISNDVIASSSIAGEILLKPESNRNNINNEVIETCVGGLENNVPTEIKCEFTLNEDEYIKGTNKQIELPNEVQLTRKKKNKSKKKCSSFENELSLQSTENQFNITSEDTFNNVKVFPKIESHDQGKMESTKNLDFKCIMNSESELKIVETENKINTDSVFENVSEEIPVLTNIGNNSKSITEKVYFENQANSYGAEIKFQVLNLLSETTENDKKGLNNESYNIFGKVNDLKDMTSSKLREMSKTLGSKCEQIITQPKTNDKVTKKNRIIDKMDVLVDETAKNEAEIESLPDMKFNEELKNTESQYQKRSKNIFESIKVNIDDCACIVDEVSNEAKGLARNNNNLDLERPIDIENDELISDTLKPEILPDSIEYPRSTSEQLVDTNNNMVIQEILAVSREMSEMHPEKSFTKATNSSVSCTNLSKSKNITSENVEIDGSASNFDDDLDLKDLKESIEKSMMELKALEEVEETVEKKICHDGKIGLLKDNCEKENKITQDIESGKYVLNKVDFSVEGLKETSSNDIEYMKATHKSQPFDKSKSETKPKKNGEQEIERPHSPYNSSILLRLSNEDNNEVHKKSSQEFNVTLSDPSENFEDAMTSSIDDSNDKKYEMIVKKSHDIKESLFDNDNINSKHKEVTSENVVEITLQQSKNCLGHTNILVTSDKIDYKKEKSKTPDTKLTKVKIKDAVDVKDAIKNQSKNTQTDKEISRKNVTQEIVKIANKEYVCKYSFRKVFLYSACQRCKGDLRESRIACEFCNLVFYCNQKHKEEDWPLHQVLCDTVCHIVNMRNQKHLYSDAKNIVGLEYRLLRMKMIVACENMLSRKLEPYEQEMLLYPRICAEPSCREWRPSMLEDCKGCGQISYCSATSSHLPESHARWCKSYSLYQKLVLHQQTEGRIEPMLPTKVMTQKCILENMNDVLTSMYETGIDHIEEIQYAALTQVATAPLTTLFGLQTSEHVRNKHEGLDAQKLCVHVVGAELRFEADALNKWEFFFLHLTPEVMELKVVLVHAELNSSNLPLDLLKSIKLCENCQTKKRRIEFSFENKNYSEYFSSEEYLTPDIVCAFNSNIQRASMHDERDSWPATINCILKTKVPFVITSYSMEELQRDMKRVTDCAEVKFELISEQKYNRFASIRPDRNFITDDEIPLLFKNYCEAVICGTY